MIQRKQTLILAIALILFILTLLMPFARFNYKDAADCTIGILGLSGIPFTETNYLFIIMQVLLTLCIALTGIAIFMYKKRPVQIRLCAFALLSNIFVIGAMFFGTEIISNKLMLAEPVNYTLIAYFPVITLLLISFAQRAVRKDEALVKSLNRIR